MIRSALAVALAIFALAIIVDRPATAATSANIEAVLEGGCPTGDTWAGPAPLSWVIPSIDRGDYTDYNGDGYGCFRIPAGFCGNRGMGEGAPVCGAWIWKDNDN